ncbi:MAG: hypothetical protein ACT6RD_12895 [Brevundimonas sp.]|uniref:hypothetical protein n=1 Tax=Brevundimonas sp. TaxID=1871086 RepID=UPI00403454C8
MSAVASSLAMALLGAAIQTPPAPTLSDILRPPAHMPAVEAALNHCLARAGDGAAGRFLEGFRRHSTEAGRWFYPGGDSYILQIDMAERADGCLIISYDWPGATEPLAAWLRARGYRSGPRPGTFERQLADGRYVTLGYFRGNRQSVVITLGVHATPWAP